jgi:hypothetical protein
MLDPDIRNRYLHDARTLRDPGDPFVASKRRHTSRDSFIQRGRHDLDGVRDAVHILKRDSARADGHIRQSIIFALYSPFVMPYAYANNYYALGHAPATIEQFRNRWHANGFPELAKPERLHGDGLLFPI